MNKNIYLAYFLTVCKHSWFWFGIWVFYYLRFTNYAGIGIIETVLIITMTTAEIPTGAVADLFGKRKTLILAFFIEAVGAIWYALTPNFAGLVGSVFIMCVGGAFYSGTLEALVYDTLKESNAVSKFGKIISNINSISLVTIALCSLVGGFFYASFFRLPFIANALFYCFGFVAAFFLVEPKVDTEKFSFTTYIFQTKQGLRQLFRSTDIKFQTFLLLSIGFVVVVTDEMLNSFLGVEYGFKEEQLGIVWAAIFVISALAAQLTPRVKMWWGERKALFVVGAIIAITLLISPILGLVAGGISLALRSSLQSMYGNLTSIAINDNTESKYRATTISTFNMIKNIPYVLCAYFFGTVADTYTAKGSAFILGIFLVGLLIAQIVVRKPKQLLFRR